MAKAELEEKLHLSEAKKHKLEQRVSALAKQNAALAKGGQVQRLRPSFCCIASLTSLQSHILCCPSRSSASMRLPSRMTGPTTLQSQREPAASGNLCRSATESGLLKVKGFCQQQAHQAYWHSRSKRFSLTGK